MRTSDFDYELPRELIAQDPPEKRGDSRMLALDPADNSMVIRPFAAITEYFHPGDLLALNNTRVIRARLYVRKATGAKLEILLLTPHDDGTVWNCLLKNSRRTGCGAVLTLLDREDNPVKRTVELVAKHVGGHCVIRFCEPDVEETLRLCGHVPLPPYIRHGRDTPPDAERYQTVYASKPGAAAAPTAGLHFTPEILARLRLQGVVETELTLHVGADTFRPVTADNIADHVMHREHFIVPATAAQQLNAARRAGRRIAAVGTTTLRALESALGSGGLFRTIETDTALFIHPPYKIRSADLLLTNFHLPKSTLLMLVAAFAGFELVMRAYQYAIRERMRFFSYGDCMLILNHI